MEFTKKSIVRTSPFLIIGISFGIAFLFGNLMGKWAFVPIILMQWALFLGFTLSYTHTDTRKKWLQKPRKSVGWNLLALVIGILPLPLFLMHHETLQAWYVWLPWIVLALVNPWIEEFYWRGLLFEYTHDWPNWQTILFTALVFALSHAVFGVNSELNRGLTVVISTFIMGIVWGLVYVKTKSLRWILLAHFLVDFFNLSAASFLDLYEKGNW